MAVVRAEGEFRLVAARLFVPGEVILTIDGVVVPAPSRHSIQVGIDAHVEAPSGTDVFTALDRHEWRFLNHSCRPNAAVRGREVVALCEIRAWEEVTFDYNTTELDMDDPFRCRCGAPDCVGEVRGWAHLDPEQRARIAAGAAPYLREIRD